MGRLRCGRTYRNRHRQTIKSASCSHEEWIVNLLKWMKGHEFNSVLIPANFKNTGRGLQTKCSIKSGETLVSLPASLLITTSTVFNSEIGHHIKRWFPKLIPQQCIAIYLIWERHKGPSSRWKPYMDSLPETFNTLAYFSAKELSFLPKSMQSKATVECQKIRQRYLEIQTHVKYHWDHFYNLLDWESFRWAWYVINTRSVYYKRDKSIYLSDEEEDNLALAPFLDLLNHSPDAKITAGFDVTTNSYKIVTHDIYKPYDQVFISYGCHGNRHLAKEYGFCVPNNSQDEVHFEFDDVVAACKQFECVVIDEKVNLLRENDMLKSLSCCIEGLTWNFWIVLKTFAMQYRHLKSWHTIFMDNEAFSEINSTARSIAKHLLQSYLTENTRHSVYIDENVTVNAHKGHVNLCRTLLDEERKILQTSIKNLDHNFFR